MKFLITGICFLVSFQVFCQHNFSKKESNLTFNGDFRFRVEHDWNSTKSNGTKRNDRSRLRYRLRYGFTYQIDSLSSFGARLRSGNIADQQGPHVTLGSKNGEFELVPIGLEKLYYKLSMKHFDFWIGKNSIGVKKLNELFWNDNVFPEGIHFQYKMPLPQNKYLQKIHFNLAHFIIHSNGKRFLDDSYLQLFQTHFSFFDKKIEFFPGYYRFRKINYIPDNQSELQLNYSIIHVGSLIKPSKKVPFSLGLEYYLNTENYQDVENIPASLKDQKAGYVLSAAYGSLKEKGDWLIYLAYADIQRFAIVDYFAQNDYARWDYSSMNAKGSRLSNFRGIELKFVYNVKKNLNLNLRTYFIEQIVKTGISKENGNRIRLDLNAKF